VTAVTITKLDYAIAVFLLLTTAGLFAQTAGFDFLNYDDDQYVFNNPIVMQGLTWRGVRQAFTGVTASNWHPVTMLSHMLDAELFGVTPRGPHVVNAALHALNAALLFIALLSLTGARWPAAVCTVLFAWHPLRVESVAWISERKDLLSGLFFMLTLIAYKRYVDLPSLKRYILVFVGLLLGLMSKPMLVTLPFLLIVLDFWPLRRVNVLRWSSLRPVIFEKVPLLVLVIAFSAIAFGAQKSSRSVAGLSVIPIEQRANSSLVGIATYLHQFVWPAKLAPLYWHPYVKPSTGLPPAQIAAAVATLAGLSVLAFLLRRRAPWLAAGWLWFIGMLVPVAGIVQVGWQAHADRYTYLPMIGITIAIVWSLSAFVDQRRIAQTLMTGAFACVALLLAVTTFNQTGHWRHSRTLWTHALAVQPPNSIALNNLGAAVATAGDVDAATVLYRRAIEINPDAAEAMKNLAVLHISRGDDPTAKQLLRQALPKNPWMIEAYSNLAGIYLREGRPDDALILYRQAVERDPLYADGYYNIATTLGQQGKFSQAAAYFERVLQIRPDDAEAQKGLQQARILAQQPRRPSQNIPALQPN